MMNKSFGQKKENFQRKAKLNFRDLFIIIRMEYPFVFVTKKNVKDVFHRPKCHFDWIIIRIRKRSRIDWLLSHSIRCYTIQHVDRLLWFCLSSWFSSFNYGKHRIEQHLMAKIVNDFEKYELKHQQAHCWFANDEHVSLNFAISFRFCSGECCFCHCNNHRKRISQLWVVEHLSDRHIPLTPVVGR